MRQTIFINGRFLTKAVTGVQRYALELLNHFDNLLNEEAYQGLRLVCLAPPVDFIAPGWKNIELRRVGINRGNLWEQIDLAFYAGGHLLFSPANTGPFYYAYQVITLHDASVFGVPDAYPAAFRAKYFFTFGILARIARMVLTDSHFSQTELSHYLGVPANRFKVILLGGDHLRDVAAAEGFLQKHGLVKGSYLLTVANQSPHKNFGRVLQAATALQSEVEFAAAGGSYQGIFQQVETHSAPSNMHLLGYVNDHQLKALYENALGFIFPSLYEGFGLPLLEAMNCGCPVLCSSAASLPEVGGDAALYFDPLQSNEMLDVIRKFLSDSGLRAQLQLRGREQAALFTWEKTARETLAALVACL